MSKTKTIASLCFVFYRFLIRISVNISGICVVFFSPIICILQQRLSDAFIPIFRPSPSQQNTEKVSEDCRNVSDGTSPIERSPYWEANSKKNWSGSSRLLRNLQVYYRLHNRPEIVPHLSQINRIFNPKFLFP